MGFRDEGLGDNSDENECQCKWTVGNWESIGREDAQHATKLQNGNCII